VTASEQLVLVDDDGAVRTLTLHRPSRLNAFTAESYQLLARLLDEADRDGHIRVVVLRGAGRAFSSGVDLDAMQPASSSGQALRESFERVVDALLSLRKPLVAAVHGPAVGFGATILLHCDIVVVAEGARLRFPFTSLGTAPEAGSTVLLPALVGPQHAADLLYSARWLEAEEAVSIGLARTCCAVAELDAKVRALAASIAAHPAPAVMAAKRLVRAGRADAVKAAMERESAEARHLSEELGPLGRP
jgi:enoyl-CoA hydratase/carnithine racemase